jgi:hypothetical protein
MARNGSTSMGETAAQSSMPSPCCLWAAIHPHELPLLNGEFEFLAAKTPEVCK